MKAKKVIIAWGIAVGLLAVLLAAGIAASASRPRTCRAVPRTEDTIRADYETKARELRLRVSEMKKEGAAIWKDVGPADRNRTDEAVAKSRLVLSRFFRELRAMQVPGVYLPKSGNGIVMRNGRYVLLSSTEEWKKEYALAKWQSAIQRAMEDELSSLRFNGLRLRQDERSTLSPEVCREFDFSQHERHLVESDADRWSFSRIKYDMEHFEFVVPPHIPAYPVNDSWAKWRDGMDNEVYGTLGKSYADYYRAFDEYVDICKCRIGRLPDSDHTARASRVTNTLSNRSLVWLMRQYCLDWGGEDDGAFQLYTLPATM